MNNVNVLAIDLAKNVFQLHGTDLQGNAVLKKKITRTQLLPFVTHLQPCKIYMEACGSSNYWGRRFIESGHQVKLIHPHYVTPYIKRNKNDANDAAGIAAAARDADMRFCEVKTTHQQDIQSVHRIRQLIIQQRTALANQLRGLLAEYGIVMPKNSYNLRKQLPDIISDNPANLSALMLSTIHELYEAFLVLDKRIGFYDQQINRLFSENEACQRLATIPGVGPLTATILASILGNGSAFTNGRHFAAFSGLTPKQQSSGGKEKLLSISKRGDTYVRTLLIHGARSLLPWLDKKTDPHSVWLKKLKERKCSQKVMVAWANQAARIAWAIVHHHTVYDPFHQPTIRKSKLVNGKSKEVCNEHDATH